MEVVWCEVDVEDCAQRMRAAYGEGKDARPILVAGRGIVRLDDARALQGYGEGALHPMDATWLAWSVEAQGNPEPIDPRQVAFDVSAYDAPRLVVPEALQGIATGEDVTGVDGCALWFLACLGAKVEPAHWLDNDALDTLYSEGFLKAPYAALEWLYNLDTVYHERYTSTRWSIARRVGTSYYRARYEDIDPLEDDIPCTCEARHARECDCVGDSWAWVERFDEQSSRYGVRDNAPLEVGLFGETCEWEKIWEHNGTRWVDGDYADIDDTRDNGEYESLSWRELMDLMNRQERAAFIGSLEWYVAGPLGEPYNPREA